MKILKIFGVVVGIHVFLLVLVFAIPGCSSTVKTAPTVADTAPKANAPAPVISLPSTVPAETAAVTTTSIAFDPNVTAAGAPADTAGVAGAGGSGTVRFVPTRPDTAVAGTLVAQPVDGVTPAASYVVKSGDNLWTIAKKNNLTVAQLTAANGGIASNSSLRPGQKLIIPSKAIAPASATAKAVEAAVSPALAATAAAKSSDTMKHTVKSGETLGGIARTYGMKGSDIAVANNISDPAKIRAGMELLIPGWEPKSGKALNAAPKAGGAAKPAETKPPVNIALPPAAEPAPALVPVVPVIRIDESAATPAPKR